MDPIRINLDDYVLSGGGANGESYDHKSDPTMMLKLYFPGKIQQPLDEMLLARKVYDMGIPTPEPGEYVVTEDGRYGIRFHRIVGKKSYSRATADHPEKVAQYAGEFAAMCRQLHATRVDVKQFENVKDRYGRLLSESPFFTTREKDRIARFIADTPDEETAIHGDLQFSNGIFVEKDGKRTQYFIDLGDFCYGYPMFDLGMVYLCCKLNDESWTLEQYHMSNATAARFWDAFADEYFHSPKCPIPGCGPDADLAEIEKTVRVFGGLKALLIESCTHCPMPEFRAVLKESILK